MASGSEADVGLRLRLFGRQEVRAGLRDTQSDTDDTADSVRTLGDRAAGAARGLASLGDRGIRAGISGLGSVAKTAAVGVAAIGAAGVAVGKGLYEVGAIFDDVSDTIRTGTGAQGAALDGLTQVALNIGQTLPATFEDIGSTVADLNTRLGLTGEPLQHVASQMLALKNLGLDTDINTVTGAMGAYGVKADQVGNVLDQLFQVSQATGVGVNELATAAQSGAPALTQFGFSIGESAALIGTLDKAGVDSAGTLGALRKGLGAFAKAGKDPQQALRETVSGLEELIKAGKDGEAINLAGGIFGTKGAAQFVAAVKSGRVNLDGLVASTGATSDTILGVAADTADFAEQWQMFKNVLLVAVKPAADAVFGAVGEQMARLTDGVRTLTGEVPALRTNLATLLDTGQIGSFGTQLEAAFALAPGTLTGLQGDLDAVIAKGQQVRGVVSVAFSALTSIPISPLGVLNGLLGFAADHTSTLKVAVIALAGAYTVAKAVTLGMAVAQGIANARTLVSTGLITANNAVYAASRSYAATWIGVKGLEAAAWARSTAQAGVNTATNLANRAVYGVGYLMTWLAVKGLELGAWLRSTAATGLNTAAVLASAAAAGVVRGAVLAWTAGQWLLNVALNANPIGLVVAGIALLIGGVVLAYNKSETFRGIVQLLWAGLKLLGGYVKDLAVKTWNGTLLPAIESGIAKFDRVKAAVGGFVDKVRDGVTWVGKLADKLTGGLVGKALSVVGVDLPGRAGGGTVRANAPYIVGEQGAELFVPGVTGSIMPSDALAAMLSSPVPVASATATPTANVDDDTAGTPDGLATLTLTVPLVVDGREIARATVSGMHSNAAWT